MAISRGEISGLVYSKGPPVIPREGTGGSGGFCHHFQEPSEGLSRPKRTEKASEG